MPIIAVASSKGGVGKTTTSYNLACELKPKRVFDQDTHSGLSVLASMREASPLPFDLVNYKTAGEMLDALKKHHAANDDGITLIDCGGYDSDITRAAIAVADLVIVPTNQTPTDRIGLGIFDGILAQISQDTGREITGYVLVCKSYPTQKHFKDVDSDVAKSSNLARMQAVIASRPDHYKNQLEGLGVTEKLTTRHTDAGKEISRLAEEVEQLLQRARA